MPPPRRRKAFSDWLDRKMAQAEQLEDFLSSDESELDEASSSDQSDLRDLPRVVNDIHDAEELRQLLGLALDSIVAHGYNEGYKKAPELLRPLLNTRPKLLDLLEAETSRNIDREYTSLIAQCKASLETEKAGLNQGGTNKDGTITVGTNTDDTCKYDIDSNAPKKYKTSDDFSAAMSKFLPDIENLMNVAHPFSSSLAYKLAMRLKDCSYGNLEEDHHPGWGCRPSDKSCDQLLASIIRQRLRVGQTWDWKFDLKGLEEEARLVSRYFSGDFVDDNKANTKYDPESWYPETRRTLKKQVQADAGKE